MQMIRKNFSCKTSGNTRYARMTLSECT